MVNNKYNFNINNSYNFDTKNNDKYYNLDDELFFKAYLNSKLFTKDYNHNNNNIDITEKTLELIIRPECNQKCDYCYITQYGDELYPKKYRKSNEEILNNLKILLDYLNSNNTLITTWDIFAGDLFYDNFWFEIMDVFYQYYTCLFEKYPFILEWLKINNYNISFINPNNCSFCDNNEKIIKVQQYIDKFLELNLSIYFSYSHDGPFAYQVREKKILNENYYNNVFKFLEKNNFGCHPMISVESIENSIQNYKWWKQQYQNYQLTEFLPMFLEVRNDGWTEEKIKLYIELLDYMIEDRLKMCDNDIMELTKNLFLVYENQKTNNIKLKPMYNNDLIRLNPKFKLNSRFVCSMGHATCLNLGNLSFVPCHRMAYPHFEAGYLKDNDLKINNNVNAYYLMKESNTMLLPGCANCFYRFFCEKGCLGSQYETNGDYLIPVQTVCNLFRTKLDFLFNKYHKLGLFHCYFKHDKIFNSKYSVESRRYLEFLLTKGYKEYEQYL